MNHFLETIEIFLEAVNAGIAIVILFLGIKLVPKLRFRLQKRSLGLFLIGVIFFSTFEVLGIITFATILKRLN